MNLSHRMNQTWTVESMTARAADGDPTYGAQRTIKVMEEDILEVIRNIRGEDINVSTKGASHDEIKYNDRVWTDGENPSTDSPKTPQIITSATDINGLKLYEVKL